MYKTPKLLLLPTYPDFLMVNGTGVLAPECSNSTWLPGALPAST